METILLSPSQVNTAEMCFRKWGFTYLDGIRTQATASQSTGTELHAIGENWLGKSEPPPATKVGEMFLPGVQHLPVPSDELLIEHGFVFHDGRLSWRGFIDCVDPTSDPILMLDHKSTKSFRWAKTPQDLLVDSQAIVYGKYLCEAFGVVALEARWVYYKTTGRPESKKVNVLLTKEHIEEAYLRLQAIGHELLTLKEKHSTGLTIEIDNFPHSGCSAFGGCSFYEVCQLKQEGKENMSTDLLQRLQNMGNKNKSKNGKTSTPAMPPPMINPPEADEPASCSGNTEQSNVASEAAIVVPSAKPGRPKTTAEAGSKKAAQEERTTRRAYTKGKGKRGQKKKEATPDITTTSTNKEVVLEPAVVESEGFTLYVDCIPQDGGVSALDFCMVAASQAASENGVEHYRLIEYGQGPAQMCLALEKLLKSQEPLKGAILLVTSNQVTADAAPVFEALASRVVRGL